MCGRYQLTIDIDQIALVFDAEARMAHGPRFNIPPTSTVPVVRRLDADGEARRFVDGLAWGLVPHWAREKKIGARMINARAETVADKPAFRSPFKRRRCLVPATGFYEWRREGKAKVPHLIRIRDAEVFAMAGIWSSWTPKDAADDAPPLETFSVLTCDPEGALGDLHHRMPVILHPDHWGLWLDPQSDRETLLGLARGTPAEVLEIYEVDRAVNNVRNQGPEVAARVG